MKKIAKFTIISIIVASAGVAAANASAGWGGKFGNCDRFDQRGAPGVMYKMKQRGLPAPQNLDLTADEAKTLVAARLLMRGNDRLKVGQVSQKDGSTYLVDIVTVDDSLVRQVEVDRDKGLPRGRFNPNK